MATATPSHVPTPMEAHPVGRSALEAPLASELPTSLGRSGSFVRFWLGSSISAFGSALTSLAIPIIAVQYLSASAAQMGVLFAAATAASLIVRLPAATWADRSGTPVRVVAAGQLLSALLVATVPLLWTLGALTFTALVGVVAAAGATAALVEAFATPIVPRIVHPEVVAAAFGRFSASRATADVAGPALAGVLLQIIAAPVLLAFDALSFLIASLLSRSVRLPRLTPGRPGAATGRADMWTVFREPFLRRCLLIVLYASLANGIASALIVLFMVRQLGFESWAVGVALGAGALGGVIAGLTVGSVHARLGVERTALFGGVLMTASLVALPLAQEGWSGLAACVFYELAGSFGAALTVITIVSEIPARLPGSGIARAMAMANLVPEAAATFGALAGGAIASGASVRTALWVSVVVVLLAGIVLVGPLLRGVARSPRSAG